MAGKTDTKKFRSKWFRVAVEGATTDKRKIERSWLEQAAKNFNQQTYGARVWLEHFRSLLPDSPFKAYGDITAVKTEEVEIAGQKKLALFAQIEPTDDLVAMNKAKQKIYTSIEIDESFADSGEAYIVGLAVTDSPASLGTDVLAFSAQKPDASPFKDRHYSATSMFTEAVEAELEFDDVTDQPGAFKDLAARVKALFTKGKETEGQFSELGEAVTSLVDFAEKQQASLEAYRTESTALGEKVTKLEETVADLTTKLGQTQDHNQQQRPPVPGNSQQVLTQY
ncbi:phage capsid protein [Pseudomonas sp. JL972]|uniref:GPO family capsid scaffolding protein n=1 Tax=Stutzerimonas degradans TaxID=2968968 RepID=UPI0012D9D496|nr:GPO family capsid scaffolding protein [Stutzerimonas degradans]MTZ12773.1 phage capsid protein [Stutzerimonas degradans]